MTTAMVRPKMWVNTKITKTSGAFELIVIEVVDPHLATESVRQNVYMPTLDGGYIYFQHFHHWTEEQLRVSVNSEHEYYDIVHVESEIEQ